MGYTELQVDAGLVMIWSVTWYRDSIEKIIQYTCNMISKHDDTYQEIQKLDNGKFKFIPFSKQVSEENLNRLSQAIKQVKDQFVCVAIEFKRAIEEVEKPFFELISNKENLTFEKHVAKIYKFLAEKN